MILIDPNHPFASWFLLLVGLGFLSVFALPLLVAPLVWARWFRWSLPEGGADLTNYFGRCVGAAAIAILVLVLQSVPHPRAHREIFEMIGVAGALLTGVHVWGAVRRTQPWTEDVEIVLYGLVTAGAFWQYAALA